MPSALRMLALLLATMPLPGCLIMPMLKIGGEPVRPGMFEVTLQESRSSFASDKILVIEVEGTISGQTETGLLRDRNMVADLAAQLSEAAQDRDIRGVLVVIDSPGGGVTASDLIHRELLRYKQKTGRPVHACMLATAASGGYYVAMAADRVTALPTTVTGSIGVIVQSFNVAGTLELIGIRPRTFTSGPLKDMGSPFRDMSDEERQVLQGMVDHMYERFVTVVHEGRPALSRERVVQLADGRSYTSAQALELGLIDSVGYLDDALDVLVAASNAKDPEVVAYRLGPLSPSSMYGAEAPGAGEPGLRVDLGLGLNRIISDPAFDEPLLYFWRPGL